MYKIACLFNIKYDDHDETTNTFVDKSFSTVKAAEYYVGRRMESKKYRAGFTKLMKTFGACRMEEICTIVDEDNNRASDRKWVYSETWL